jgi:hypothetical protein
MNQHPAAMTRLVLVPALGRAQVQELARYKFSWREQTGGPTPRVKWVSADRGATG